MDFLINKFLELPKWAKYLSIFIFSCVFYGVEQAWGERRFIANFAEATFTAALHIGSIVISLFLTAPIWRFVEARTRNKYFVWIVGTLFFLIVMALLSFIIMEIPGVGWRYEQMIT